MRRQPTDTGQFLGNNIFSADTWGSAATTFTPVVDEMDISFYAATIIPHGNTQNAQSTRYGLSPHSSQYEPSQNLTNSHSDPFTHPSYDGATGETQIVEPPRVNRHLLPQNIKYDTMATPTRQFRTGEPIPATPAQDLAPSPEPASSHTSIPSSFGAFGSSAAPEVEEHTALSDFELEFMSSQKTQEVVVDLTKAEQPHPTVSHAPVSQAAPIEYQTGNVGYSHPHYDDFYTDPRDSHQTIQIDMEFISRHAKKLVVIAIAVVLVLALFVILKPSSAEPKTVPAETVSPVKKVVTPEVTVEQPAGFDANGNPIYNSNTNSNFDGQ